MSFIQGTDELKGVDLSFEANPNTGDLGTLSKYAAIRRSLEAILSYRPLDKPFREDIGSSLNTLLFNVVSISDLPALRSRIENTIERLEPRIGVSRIDITPKFDQNQLDITISYVIKRTKEEDTFSTILKTAE